MTLACFALLPFVLQAPSTEALPNLTWLDVDADDRVDLVVLDPAGGLRLMRSLGAAGFADETTRWGLVDLPPVNDVLADDTDGDGSVDLVLSGPAGLRLLRQSGGAFVDATTLAGLDGLVEVASLTGVDANGDGRSDLHVVAGGRHRVFASLPSGSFEELELSLPVEAGLVERFGTPAVVSGAAADSSGPEGASQGRASNAGGRPTGTLGLGGPGGTGSPINVTGTTTGPAIAGGTISSTGAATTLTACSLAVDDVAGTNCIQASSVPTLGMLYPLGVEFFIDAFSGYVGMGTIFPAYPLHVVGQVVSGTNNDAPGAFSTLGGGRDNGAGGDDSVVSGGQANDADGNGSAIGGGSWNVISGEYSVVGGGGDGTSGLGNRITLADRCVVAGGAGNVIAEASAQPGSAEGSVVGGGISNQILTLAGDGDVQGAFESTIGGGSMNRISGVSQATIGGGVSNAILGEVFGFGGIVGGTIAGGGSNEIDEASFGTIGGGIGNVVSEGSGTIGGGSSNTVSAFYGTISGGWRNSVDGQHATVPGGRDNVADGSYSLAAGRRAKALHNGAFVWGDETDADFASTADNQFLIRASGGVGIGTNTPTSALEVRPASGVSTALQAFTSAPTGIGINAQATGAGGIGIVAGGSQAGLFTGEVLVTGGSDVGLSGGSFVQCGSLIQQNVAIDSNEIMARNNGAPADLSLNIEGGNVEMVASGSGRVGIGTSGPAAKLDIYGESSADIFRARVDGTTRLVLDGNGGLAVGAKFTPSYDLEISALAPNGGTAAKPGGGSWSNSSDRRLKKNIEDLEGALDTLLALRGVTFEYKDPASINELEGTRIGFIAQEVEEILPDWVSEKPDGMKMVTVRGFEALAVEALREQQETISARDGELATQAEHLARQDAELARLRSLVEATELHDEELAELRAQLAALLQGR